MEVTHHTLAPAELAAAFGRRLRDAGLPTGPERAARFADALELVRPVARRRLYWTARAVFVSARSQGPAFDAVFAAVFGGVASPADLRRDEPAPAPTTVETEAPPVDYLPGQADAGELAADAGGAPALAAGPQPRESDSDREQPVAVLASAEEILREKRFDAVTAAERGQLNELMAELRVRTPRRRARRYARRRHGRRVDLRRSLRASLRTGGDPVRLRRRERRLTPRRLVLLCDISGSMEPYARAYLQFLACAADAGPRAEAFVFATRLTRVTRALAARDPDRALHRAAEAAPDWSSGTRIGDALRAFNDRHGRRGMARGAVVVILSDGWERGEPTLVGREMERLARLAHRIVWVNPRVSAAGFSPRTGGMAAALPHCDALVSGESLAALSEVAAAIAEDHGPRGAAAAAWPEAAAMADEAPEPWASATPVPGSSVAMPSGYGPRRGRTTPGWSAGS